MERFRSARISRWCHALEKVKVLEKEERIYACMEFGTQAVRPAKEVTEAKNEY